jgi:hypothetical protein
MEEAMRRTSFVIITMLLSCASLCYALEPVTHENINEYVARNTLDQFEFSLDSFLKDQLDVDEGVLKIYDSMRVYQWLREGGLKEDIPAWYLIYVRPLNHFHNPLTELGWAGWTSSIEWSQEPVGAQGPGGSYSWLDVRDYFYKALISSGGSSRNHYFAQTFRGLGQLMHLVQDLSVPEHARDDFHARYCYEDWVGNIVDYERLRDYHPIYFDPSVIGDTNFPNLPFTNLFDTNTYNGLDPAVTLKTGTYIADTGLSEYTNANFLSPDTMFTSDFPFPRIEDCVLYPDNDRLYLKIDSSARGEKVSHLAAASYLYWYRMMYFPEDDSFPPVILDPVCYQEYASNLLPRAIGYSAGLLDYFFRGEIDMIPMGSGYVIVNNTEEAMNGTFELYYDNTSGQRLQIPGFSFDLNIPRIPVYPWEPDNKSPNIQFSEPGDAQESGKYILVFRGELGNETNAVVGKVVECQMKSRYVFYANLGDGNKWYYWDPEHNEYTAVGGLPIDDSTQAPNCSHFQKALKYGDKMFYVLASEMRDWNYTSGKWESFSAANLGVRDPGTGTSTYLIQGNNWITGKLNIPNPSNTYSGKYITPRCSWAMNYNESLGHLYLASIFQFGSSRYVTARAYQIGVDGNGALTTTVIGGVNGPHLETNKTWFVGDITSTGVVSAKAVAIGYDASEDVDTLTINLETGAQSNGTEGSGYYWFESSYDNCDEFGIGQSWFDEGDNGVSLSITKSNAGGISSTGVDQIGYYRRYQEIDVPSQQNDCSENSSVWNDKWASEWPRGVVEQYEDSWRHCNSGYSCSQDVNVEGIYDHHLPFGLRGVWDVTSKVISQLTDCNYDPIHDPCCIYCGYASGLHFWNVYDLPTYTGEVSISGPGISVMADVTFPDYTQAYPPRPFAAGAYYEDYTDDNEIVLEVFTYKSGPYASYSSNRWAIAVDGVDKTSSFFSMLGLSSTEQYKVRNICLH